MKSNVSQIFDKAMKFKIRVSNFLNYYKEGEIVVVRKNNALPRAQLNELKVTSKVSKIIKLKGKSVELILLFSISAKYQSICG